MFIVCCANGYDGYAGDGGNAPSLVRRNVDGSLVPLGSTTTHDPMG